MAKPPSIGEEQGVPLILAREEYPLPKTRKEVLVAIETILQAGGVQELLVRIDQPILVKRLVVPTGMENEEEEEASPEAEDLYAKARNARIETLKIPEAWSPFETIFQAFAAAKRGKLVPKVFMSGSHARLRDWFGFDTDGDVSSLCGVECVEHLELPAETLLLLEASPLDPEGVAASLRMEIE